MKTNKIILGIAAVLFAAGAAFASVTTSTQTVWYRQVEGNPNSNCLNVELDIDCIPEEGDCRRPTPHNPNSKLFNDSNCSQELNENSGF